MVNVGLQFTKGETWHDADDAEVVGIFNEHLQSKTHQSRWLVPS